VFLVTSCIFFSTKLENKRGEQVIPATEEGCEEEGDQTMYTNVSKYKNDKIKVERKKKEKRKVFLNIGM
jgi:hypothetical protein